MSVQERVAGQKSTEEIVGNPLTTKEWLDLDQLPSELKTVLDTTNSWFREEQGWTPEAFRCFNLPIGTNKWRNVAVEFIFQAQNPPIEIRRQRKAPLFRAETTRHLKLDSVLKEEIAQEKKADQIGSIKKGEGSWPIGQWDERFLLLREHGQIGPFLDFSAGHLIGSEVPYAVYSVGIHPYIIHERKEDGNSTVKSEDCSRMIVEMSFQDLRPFDDDRELLDQGKPPIFPEIR